jgi:hypothetical protein
LTNLSKSLQSLNLTSNGQHIVYVDGQGQKVADSDGSQSLLTANIPTTQNESSFADLEAFKNAINGQSGSTTEKINGNMVLISYHPVNVFSNVWVVLFMEPYPVTEIRSSSSDVSSYHHPQY